MDDAGSGGKAQGLDFFHALFEERVVELDSGTVGLEFFSGHDNDAAIAGTQIEHFFAGLETAELQHLFDDDFRSGVIRGQLLGLLILRA